jgi:AcrR family transcriptional regulator
MEKAQLPAGLDLLWGRREGGKRGPRPGLSADAIVDAAIRLADAEGLEGVSMARVAAELGFTTMSLYRYVASKEELLQLMWNGSARGAEGLVLEGDGWRAKLRMWAIVQRDMLDRHPWLTQMPMAAPPMAPNSMIFVERGLGAMDGTALADADKLRCIGLISSYTLSEARMANDALRAARDAAAAAAAAAGDGDGDGDGGEPAPPWTYDALVRELADEATYPRLYKIAWTPPPGSGEGGPGRPPSEREEFLFGLDRILDGIQAYMDRAGSTT